MRIDFFEHDYSQLLDSDDATNILGTAGIHRGIATVGDIRKACEGRPKDSSIYLNGDGWGFYVTDIHSKFFTV